MCLVPLSSLISTGVISALLLGGSLAPAQKSPDDQKAQQKQVEQQAKQREKSAKAHEKAAKAQAKAAEAQQKAIEDQQKAANHPQKYVEADYPIELSR